MIIQTLRKIFGLFYDSYSSFFLVSVTDLSIFPHPGDAAEEVRGAVKSSPGWTPHLCSAAPGHASSVSPPQSELDTGRVNTCEMTL